MRAQERRDNIAALLANATEPMSASKLATQLSVSRQLIVGDIALLRASGIAILATPRGYVMQSEQPLQGQTYTVACHHDANHLIDELYLMVDCGCTVLDVIVAHAVYGQLSAPLQIASRYDADAFYAKLQANAALPLCHLTGDIHLHTLLCPTPAHYERVVCALDAQGFLCRD